MKMNDSQRVTYRPEIDGLRAVAVVSVLLFHGELKCPGGYVGVDVFFVISGFLITSLILRDLRAGSFSLGEFWERRIRRIMPALLLMVLVTLLVGGLLLMPGDYRHLAGSTIAQAIMGANVFFWRDGVVAGGYFAKESEERPLLHTWSLSVEEQFYVIFPVVLALMFKSGVLKRPRVLQSVLLASVVAGLVGAVYALKVDPSAAFYLLPARAWELLCGAWLASLSAESASGRRWVREVASLLGLAGILVPFFLYTDETTFPGLAAVPPCLGAMLVIWSGGSKDGGREGGATSVGRILKWRPVVFIGLISYSLYLWHWPVLVFGRYWWFGGMTWYFRAGLLVLAGVLGFVSWRFVETPFRRKAFMATRSSAFRFAVTGTSIVLMIGTCITMMDGLPGRFSPLVERNEKAAADTCGRENLTVEAVEQGRLFVLGDTAAGGSAKVLLWGDSHARCAAPALDALCREAGVRGVAAIHNGNPPLLGGGFFPLMNSLSERSPAFNKAVFQYIKDHKVPHVVLGAFWGLYQDKNRRLLEESLMLTIELLHAEGVRVWVLQDVPVLGAPGPKALAHAAIFGNGFDWWLRSIRDHRESNAVVYAFATKGLPAVFIDPAPLFVEGEGETYRADAGGVSLYHDDDHLTRTASVALLLPLFREAMMPELVKAGRP